MNKSLLSVSLTVIWGAIIYYLYALNTAGIVITLVLTVLSFFILKGFFLEKADYEKPEKLINYLILNKTNSSIIIGFSILAALAFRYFFSAASDRALISPWQAVNHDFFWIYALSALVLTLLIVQSNIKTGLKITALSIFYFLSFGAAAIIYQIGYGFDPFIHQATMELIAQKGAVLPKTPYYLGEYGLIVILSKISGLPIYFLNKFLVPFLAALFLPTSLYNFLKRQWKSTPAVLPATTIFLTVLFLLALSFSPFIVTTPQNLSYLFLILAVLSAAGSAKPGRVFILSLASVAIHPLAGLPALALSAFVALRKYKDRINVIWKKIIKTAIWVFAALSIPAALFISAGSNLNNLGNGKIFSLKIFLSSLLNLFGAPSGAGREDFVSNFIYLAANNFNLIIILLIIAASYNIIRSKNISENFKKTNNGLIAIASALLGAYLLSGQIAFGGIINYEQSGYADRIPVLIMIFMLPSITVFLRDAIGLILKEKKIIKILWLAFGLGLLTVSLYISYPRFDKYFNSRGYSTSANDMAAVKSIDSETDGPYIVLANQQVSAAALKTFGFDHYYRTGAGELYFYPIPTGSPLYRYYLDMVYKSPDRRSMIEALDLAGVDKGYLIVNKYWYQSGRIIGEAKLTADKWWTISNEVFIFAYER